MDEGKEKREERKQGKTLEGEDKKIMQPWRQKKQAKIVGENDLG